MFGDTDLREIANFVPIDSYPEDFLEIVRQQNLPTIYTGGIENHPAILDAIGTLWGNRGTPLALARDPFWWTPRLKQLGINVPEVRRHDQPPDDNMVFLTKPFAGAGGINVHQANSEQAIESECFFQEFVEGDLVSVVFIGTANGSTLCGVTRQIVWRGLQNDQFFYGGSVGPIEVPKATAEQIQKIGTFFAMESGLRGLFGVDLILRHDGSVTPIEVNPRYTASVEVVEVAFSSSLLNAHRMAFAGTEYELAERSNHQFAAKVILYAADNVTIDDTFHQQVLPDGSRMADIPLAGSVIETGHPICTLLAYGATLTETCDLAATSAETIRPRASLGLEVRHSEAVNPV
jgi:predicted ATP-grasp superfamily ATP-dependent carboligase